MSAIFRYTHRLHHSRLYAWALDTLELWWAITLGLLDAARDGVRYLVRQGGARVQSLGNS